MVPEALRSLTGEERHRVYRMLRLEAVPVPEGLRVSGALGDTFVLEERHLPFGGEGVGSAAPVVDALCQVPLLAPGHQRVGGVHHVAHIQLADLGEELVGVEELEAVIRRKPLHELGVGYAGRVLHRAGASHGHDVLLGLYARPGYLAVLYELEGNGDPRGDLQGDAAELSLALGDVTVTCEEEAALDAHRQVDRVPDAGVRHVHIAAVVAGGERGDGLYGRGGADGADEGPHRDLPVPPASYVSLYPVLPDPIGKRVMEGRRQRRGGEAPEVRHEAAYGPVAGELDVLDADGQGVARLGALDVYRPRLRVQVRTQSLARAVFLGGDGASESVLGIDRHRLAALHPRDGLVVRAHREVVGALLMDLPDLLPLHPLLLKWQGSFAKRFPLKSRNFSKTKTASQRERGCRAMILPGSYYARYLTYVSGSSREESGGQGG